MNTITLIEKLWQDTVLAKEEYVYLIRNCSLKDRELLAARAEEVRQSYYGKDVYVRGLIEFTNYCRNNCYYCGIRAENKNADRYRLSAEEILECVEEGYTLGFRTFVLQGGEDFSYSTEDIGSLIAEIKKRHNDCAVTLSLGERERDVYQYWYDCGDRGKSADSKRRKYPRKQYEQRKYKRRHAIGSTVANAVLLRNQFSCKRRHKVKQK